MEAAATTLEVRYVRSPHIDILQDFGVLGSLIRNLRSS